MHSIYNFIINSAQLALPLGPFFGQKLKEFSRGRKKVFERLKKHIETGEKYIWIHAASLGEFEQALPVMEMLQKDFPKHRLLVTFFSPSGYENKKSHPLAHLITYLPLDTRTNATRFLEIVQPELVFFVKYDIWPNFLTELKKKKIRTFLISGAFRENQIYFRSYGKFMREALHTFEHIFVQNHTSLEVLKQQGFNNVSLSGDTRFDRVARQLEYDNKLEVIEQFLGEHLCVVAGSTWPEDEEILLEYINKAPEDIKFIVAPHEIKAEKIADFRKNLKVSSILYSETPEKNPADHRLLIIDNIGLLSKIYSYAHIAYVGGAAGKTGLHNILEPATFGIPVLTGKNISRFPEAVKLEQLAGLYTAASPNELTEIFQKMVQNQSFRRKTGMIAGHFINSNTGATRAIQQYLQENRS